MMDNDRENELKANPLGLLKIKSPSKNLIDAALSNLLVESDTDDEIPIQLVRHFKNDPCGKYICMKLVKYHPRAIKGARWNKGNTKTRECQWAFDACRINKQCYQYLKKDYQKNTVIRDCPVDSTNNTYGSLCIEAWRECTNARERQLNK